MLNFRLPAILLLSLIIFMGGLFISTTSYAEETKKAENHARVELIKTQPYFEAGSTYRLGIAFKMDPDWHIYWRFGGETGLPPQFFWALPEGLSSPEILWPTPEYIATNKIINYGYHNEVMLFADFPIDQDVNRETLDIFLDLEWLVCKDICIPEFGTYEITIPSKNAYNGENFTPNHNIKKFEAQLPKTFDGDVYFEARDFQFDVLIKPNAALYEQIKSTPNNGGKIFFAPHDWGWIKLSSEPAIFADDVKQLITLTYPRGHRAYKDLTNASGSIALQHIDGVKSFDIAGKIHKMEVDAAEDTAPKKSTASEKPTTAPQEVTEEAIEEEARFTLWHALIFAFLGGLILNLMPCVFPILSLKALSLVKASDKEHIHAISGGIAYSLGVILSFVAIAGIMIALQETGSEIGWGFQLQDKTVLYVLTLLMFAIGLSLIGALKLEKFLPQSITGIGQKQANAGGLSGSFFTGLLATLVAAPCTAPFMAGAIGFATTQPPLQSLSIFAALGAGLAFPYFLLTAVPPARKILPRPGAWMEGFRQFLAFPMFATAIWLGLTLVKQDGYTFLTPLLSAVLAFAFFVWLLDKSPKSSVGRILKGISICISLILVIFIPIKYQPMDMPEAIPMNETKVSSVEEGNIHYKFTQNDLADALQAHPERPIFVYLTADWCITCKVNERRVLATKKIKTIFADNNVKVFKGDWTKMNSDITQYLKSFNRNGVPLYIYYGPVDANTGQRPKAVLLPQLLTFGHIENLFN